MTLIRRPFFATMLILFVWTTPLVAEEEKPEINIEATQARLQKLEGDIFELDRKRRKYRLWSSHYQREARRMMSKDLGLYRTRMRQSEENRVKARVMMDQIISLEEEKHRLQDRLEAVR